MYYQILEFKELLFIILNSFIGFLIFIWPQNYRHWLKFFALMISCFVFFCSLLLWIWFDESHSNFQFITNFLETSVGVVTDTDKSGYLIGLGVGLSLVGITYFFKKLKKKGITCYFYGQLQEKDDLLGVDNYAEAFKLAQKGGVIPELLYIRNNTTKVSQIYFSYIGYNLMDLLCRSYLRSIMLSIMAKNFNRVEMDCLMNQFPLQGEGTINDLFLMYAGNQLKPALYKEWLKLKLS